MARFSITDFYVPVIAFHEQVAGWFAYRNKAQKLQDPAKKRQAVVRGYRMFQQVLTDFAEMQVLPFDKVAGLVVEDWTAITPKPR